MTQEEFRTMLEEHCGVMELTRSDIHETKINVIVDTDSHRFIITTDEMYALNVTIRYNGDILATVNGISMDTLMKMFSAFTAEHTQSISLKLEKRKPL
ncbi:MAG: hypothetical protein ACI4SO_07495 [Muribaculaceae bacterium]